MMANELNTVTGAIVDAAFNIDVNLGPGLLESVYETILARDLARQGFHVERQKTISFDYQGLWFENAFRVDLLIESQVVVEVKSVVSLAEAHTKQLLTYVRLLDYPAGLLLNFGSSKMKDGIKRVVNRDMSDAGSDPHGSSDSDAGAIR